MRVCLILEGCYPYLRGGVSTWAHDYISSNPDIDFVLWTVHAARKYLGDPVYKLPDNVVENREIYFEDGEQRKIDKKTTVDLKKYIDAAKLFLADNVTDWNPIFNCCCNHDYDINQIVMSEEFLEFAKDISNNSNGKIGLSDAYYGLKSIIMPIMFLMQQEIPDADLFHSAVTGYGGILGSIAKFRKGKPFILTEHGIYPREREEELMLADWIAPSMRKYWVRVFYNFSRCAYHYADKVTALFKDASRKQIEIGCMPEKCSVVANGIHVSNFETIDIRNRPDVINIGAFIRFAPIKDLKTMIYAFHNLQKSVKNVALYIMGGTDDENYKKECENLIHRLDLQHIHILGHINTVEYIAKMDLTVMTSISEGQPLALLESLASGRPCVSTNVGNCDELLAHPTDDYGPAGICCRSMDIEGITKALKKLCLDHDLRRTMGEDGRKRVRKKYTHELMNKRYLDLYHEVV